MALVGLASVLCPQLNTKEAVFLVDARHPVRYVSRSTPQRPNPRSCFYGSRRPLACVKRNSPLARDPDLMPASPARGPLASHCRRQIPTPDSRGFGWPTNTPNTPADSTVGVVF